MNSEIKPILSSEYLYGVQPKHFDNFQYFDAILEKIELGYEVKQQLTRQRASYPFNSKEFNDLRIRYNEVERAIAYNKALYIERYPNFKF